jgi:hypothetical protein
MNQKLAVGLTLLSLTVPCLAEPARPMMAGVLKAINPATGMVVIKLQDGRTKTAHLGKKAHYKRLDHNVGFGSFVVGMKVSIRIAGSLNDSPLEADLLTDWMTSGQYVATSAAAPYETRMGDYATTSGVGGNNPGMVSGQSPERTIGIMGNGGSIPGPNGSIQTPVNQGNQLTAAAPMLTGATPAGMMNGMTPQQQAQQQMMQAQQMEQQVQNGMSAGNMMDPSGEGAAGGMGGPPQMASQQMGSPVNMQATVVSMDLASRTIIVKVANSQMTQTVILSAQAPMPAFQAGQMVAISGFSTPQGVIQANSVVPIGH